MAENERTPDCENGAALKEAVCIDAMRIYDSCSDKDCLEDLRVLFPASVQPVVDASANVRVRDVDVISVYIDMQPIPFNRGYYSIDLTFFFDVSLELYGGATVGCERVSGVSIFFYGKYTILFLESVDKVFPHVIIILYHYMKHSSALWNMNDK